MIDFIKTAVIVTCEWCAKQAPSVAPDWCQQSKSGSGIAVSILKDMNGKWFAVGGYGSQYFDIYLMEFKDKLPEHEADPVCDECITHLVKSGALVVVGLRTEKTEPKFCVSYNFLKVDR